MSLKTINELKMGTALAIHQHSIEDIWDAPISGKSSITDNKLWHDPKVWGSHEINEDTLADTYIPVYDALTNTWIPKGGTAIFAFAGPPSPTLKLSWVAATDGLDANLIPPTWVEPDTPILLSRLTWAMDGTNTYAQVTGSGDGANTWGWLGRKFYNTITGNDIADGPVTAEIKYNMTALTLTNPSGYAYGGFRIKWTDTALANGSANYYMYAEVMQDEGILYARGDTLPSTSTWTAISAVPTVPAGLVTLKVYIYKIGTAYITEYFVNDSSIYIYTKAPTACSSNATDWQQTDLYGRMEIAAAVALPNSPGAWAITEKLYWAKSWQGYQAQGFCYLLIYDDATDTVGLVGREAVDFWGITTTTLDFSLGTGRSLVLSQDLTIGTSDGYLHADNGVVSFEDVAFLQTSHLTDYDHTHIHDPKIWGTKEIDETDLADVHTPVYATATGKYGLRLWHEHISAVIPWDFSWYASNDLLPGADGWTRTVSIGGVGGGTLYTEEIQTIADEKWLVLDYAKTSGEAPGDMWCNYSKTAALDIKNGFVFTLKTNVISVAGATTTAIYLFRLFFINSNAANTCSYISMYVPIDNYNTVTLADGGFPGTTSAVDPSGTHIWTVVGFTTSGTNSYVMVYYDGILFATQKITFVAGTTQTVSFGDSILACYGAGRSKINFQYFKLKYGPQYTIIEDAAGSDFGGAGVVWDVGSLHVWTDQFNVGTLLVGGAVTLCSTLTLGTLAGVLIGTAGLVSAIAAGTANQVFGINNAGTGYEFKTVEGTSNQVVVVLSTANKITLSTPQSIHSGASPTFAGLTLTGLTGILKGSTGVVGAITVGTANQILGINNAGTDYEYKTVTAGTGITITLTAANVITITNSAPAVDDPETDPVVGAITGIVKANGAGVISAASPGTDFEAALGNPATTGFVLSSTDAGVRSWVEVAAAGSNYIKTFTSADLTAGVLTVNHAFNSQYCTVQVFDNNNVMVLPDTVTLTDVDNIAIDLSSYGAISGTWHAVALLTGGDVAGGASTLDDLTDVVITSVGDGEVLTYDTATSKWINAAPAGGSGGASIIEIQVFN